MRIILIVLWLMIGLAGAIFHLGPGKENLVLDDAANALRSAQVAVQSENWGDAIDHYDKALELLPPEKENEARRVRLEKAKAQMMNSKLPDSRKALQGLLNEMLDDPAADPQLVQETRSSLASAQYYMTWLMRLEGVPKQIWEPEIEAARQNYRLIAETAQQQGQLENAKTAREDLESAIRLARMDLSELQGLPLPSQ